MSIGHVSANRGCRYTKAFTSLYRVVANMCILPPTYNILSTHASPPHTPTAHTFTHPPLPPIHMHISGTQLVLTLYKPNTWYDKPNVSYCTTAHLGWCALIIQKQNCPGSKLYVFCFAKHFQLVCINTTNTAHKH